MVYILRIYQVYIYLTMYGIRTACRKRNEGDDTHAAKRIEILHQLWIVR